MLPPFLKALLLKRLLTGQAATLALQVAQPALPGGLQAPVVLLLLDKSERLLPGALLKAALGAAKGSSPPRPRPERQPQPCHQHRRPPGRPGSRGSADGQQRLRELTSDQEHSSHLRSAEGCVSEAQAEVPIGGAYRTDWGSSRRRLSLTKRHRLSLTKRY